METIKFENDFFKIVHLDYQGKSILMNIWKEASEDMEDEDFKQCLCRRNEFYKQNPTQYCIADTKDFKFLVMPDVQEWYNTTINRELNELGLKKQAFVLSKDEIAELSIEQTLEEQEIVNIGHFDTREKALDWLIH